MRNESHCYGKLAQPMKKGEKMKTQSKMIHFTIFIKFGKFSFNLIDIRLF